MSNMLDMRIKTDTIVIASAILLLFLMFYAHFISGNAGDKTWLLIAAHKLLEGGKLSVDVFELNPPLIIWMYTVPVWLSLHFKFLQDYNFLVLLGGIAILGSVFISLNLIKKHPEFASDRKKQVEFCLMLATILISFTNPAYFFDREHIFLVLVLPYIIRWMPSVAGGAVPTRLRIIIGIMAGIGFCIKPHCFIVFAFIQIIYFFRSRSVAILVTVENIIIYILAIIYISLIWLLTPEYISVMMPMVLATYSYINARLSGLLYFCYILLGIGVTFSDFRLCYNSPYRKDIFYLSLVCLALLIYAISNNGWGYTWNPLASIATIVTCYVLWDFLYLKKEYETQGVNSKQFLFGVRSCMTVLLFNMVVSVWCVSSAIINGCGDNSECQFKGRLTETIETVNNGKPVKSFGSISIHIGLWANVCTEMGAKWQTRFSHIWMLPKFFVADADFVNMNKWIPEYVSNSLAEDMKRNKPEIMFVEDTDIYYSVNKYIDLIAYLSPSHKFAEEWQHYVYAGKVYDSIESSNKKGHSGYFLYKRIN